MSTDLQTAHMKKLLNYPPTLPNHFINELQSSRLFLLKLINKK